MNKATQNGVTTLPREANQTLPDSRQRPMSTIEAALSPNAVLEFPSQSAGLVSQSPPVAAVPVFSDLGTARSRRVGPARQRLAPVAGDGRVAIGPPPPRSHLGSQQLGPGADVRSA